MNGGSGLTRRAARVLVNEIWQEAAAQAHTQRYFVRLSLQGLSDCQGILLPTPPK